MVKKMDWSRASTDARVRREHRQQKVQDRVDAIVNEPEHIFDTLLLAGHPMETIELTLIANCQHKGMPFGAYEGNNGKYYAARRSEPCFCLEADTLDVAVKQGTDAVAFYLKWLEKERT